jgi:DNA-binding phage protein
VCALPSSEVEAIRERFASLNPYDRSVVPGSVLKLEDENFLDDKREERCSLMALAVSEKSYALFALDERGEPVIRKYSSFVLGQYRSPIPGDREGRWIQDAWAREIRAALGQPVEAFSWEQYPAIAPLTLSTWNALRPYRDNAGPFDFVAAAVVSHKLLDIAARPYACCAEPRPACMPFPNVADWQAQEWRCLRCETPWDFERFPRFLTYGEIVTATLQHVERKRLSADGSEQTKTSRSLTTPRPVRVETKKPIGKERPVDPTDTAEGLTFEQIDATKVLVYTDPAERLTELRAEIIAEGIPEFVARNPGMSRSQVYAFVNEGTTPHASTIEKLETALR